MSYRLIDELPSAKTRPAPWPPVGIFLLTFAFLPFSVPFWMVNWGRLGQPKQRLVAAGLGALAVVPVVVQLANPALNVDILITILKIVFAYSQLNMQRSFFISHKMRGGGSAPVWPLWVAAAIGLPLQIMLWMQ